VRFFVVGLMALNVSAGEGVADRAYQVQVMTRIARPVLEALAANKLKERMPVRDWEKGGSPMPASKSRGAR
jgi:hypothetical protein